MYVENYTMDDVYKSKEFEISIFFYFILIFSLRLIHQVFFIPDIITSKYLTTNKSYTEFKDNYY